MEIRFVKAWKRKVPPYQVSLAQKKIVQKHRSSSLKISFFRKHSQQQQLVFFQVQN